LKKVLIVRFSSIGDIVLTSPLLRQLSHRGDIEVHYLTKKAFLPLLEANPYINRIWSIEKSVSEILPALRNERFDLIIDLHRNIRSTILLLALRRPFRRFRKLNFRKWLLVKLKINLLPKLHVVDRYLAAAGELVINDDQGLDYFIPPEQEIDLRTRFPELLPGYYCLSVGSLHRTKQIPVGLAAEIIGEAALPVVLLGATADRPKGEEITAICSAGKAINLCGQLSLGQSASMIRQCNGLISSDTGLMHIGAALRKKVISVWGNTVPDFGMSPYFPKKIKNLSVIIEVEGLSCRPCSKLGYEQCPKGHFRCMNDIRVDQIAPHIKT
jgi:ADP-heptose:LPS heptosyltransferase